MSHANGDFSTRLYFGSPGISTVKLPSLACTCRQVGWPNAASLQRTAAASKTARRSNAPGLMCSPNIAICSMPRAVLAESAGESVLRRCLAPAERVQLSSAVRGRSRASIKPADCPSIRGSITVTAVMWARIPSLTGIAAERVPAAIVRCAANPSGIDMGTVVRESVARNECDADERCGRKAEGQVAQHGHLLSWRSFLAYHSGECFTPCLRRS